MHIYRLFHLLNRNWNYISIMESVFHSGSISSEGADFSWIVMVPMGRVIVRIYNIMKLSVILLTFIFVSKLWPLKRNTTEDTIIRRTTLRYCRKREIHLATQLLDHRWRVRQRGLQSVNETLSQTVGAGMSRCRTWKRGERLWTSIKKSNSLIRLQLLFRLEWFVRRQPLFWYWVLWDLKRVALEISKCLSEETQREGNLHWTWIHMQVI